MIDYLNDHQYAFWFTVGFGMLVSEALVLGFSSGFILFAGLAALMTGVLMWLDWLPQTWFAGLASFSICSVVISAALWKPLRKLQDDSSAAPKDNSSDLVGYTFNLKESISRNRPGKHRYSGIDWRVEVADSATVDAIEAGTPVTVDSVDTGVFRVRPQYLPSK